MNYARLGSFISVSMMWLLFAGCASDASPAGGRQETGEQAVSQQAAAAGADRTSLVFDSGFTAELPADDTYEVFELTEKPALKPQALYDLFDKNVEQYFPGEFTAAEKESLYAINGTDAAGEPLTGNYAENRERILRGEVPVPWLWFTSERGQIQMMSNGSLLSFIGTAAYQIQNGTSGNIGMYCAAEDNPVSGCVHIPLCSLPPDTEYPLSNGTVSMRKAYEITMQTLNADISVHNPELKPDITDVWVIKMANGVCGLHFWLTCQYQGIRFDTYPMRHGLGFETQSPEMRPYKLYPGYAFMIEPDKLDSIVAFGELRACDISAQQEKQIAVSYEDAQDLLAEAVANLANIRLKRAEFVYLPVKDSQDDAAHMTVEAVWKFLAENETDHYGYVFYVNADTGAVEYYKY